MKRNRSNLLGFVIALGCIGLVIGIYQFFYFEEAPAPTETVENLDTDKIRESIVRIEIENDPPGYGTGFFVAPDLIATNIHVVALPRPTSVVQIDIVRQVERIDKKGSTQITSDVEKKTFLQIEGVTAYDVKNDLVILKVAAEGTPLPIGNSNEVKIGPSITIPSYRPPTTFMGIRGKSYRIKKGKIYSIRKSDKWLRTDIDLSGGSSGSPVLNSKGEVIGIHAGGNDTFGYSLAIPSNILKKLLSKSKTVEPLVEWQKRELIRSYANSVQGQNSYNLRLYKDALVALDNAIQLNPKVLYAYSVRGSVKYSIGMSEARLGNLQKAQRLYKEAVKDYNRAIKINSKDANAFTLRGSAKFELGDKKGALTDYNKAIKINDRHEQIYYIKALSKLEQGDFESQQGNAEKGQRLYEDAIFYYTYALKHAPKSFHYYLARANVKFYLGKSKADHGDARAARRHYQGAIEDFDKAIQLNPSFAKAYYKRALVKETIGHKEAAKADFDRAKELDPNVKK